MTPTDETMVAVPSILIVEDEIVIRTNAVIALRECGFHVSEAGNVDDAIGILNDTQVDLVFSDITMPGSRDGVDLAQWLRRERPGVRIILTSGAMPLRQATASLCDDLLDKPYTFHDLERRIRELLICHGSHPE